MSHTSPQKSKEATVIQRAKIIGQLVTFNIVSVRCQRNKILKKNVVFTHCCLMSYLTALNHGQSGNSRAVSGNDVPTMNDFFYSYFIFVLIFYDVFVALHDTMSIKRAYMFLSMHNICQVIPKKFENLV